MNIEFIRKTISVTYIALILFLFFFFTIGQIYTPPKLEKLNESQCIQELNSFFCTFPGIQVIDGRWKHYSPWGDHLMIRFKLPETRNPQEWLILMANKISNEKNFDFKRVSKNRVEQAVRNADLHYVEYDPDNELYEAHWAWD